MEIYDKEYGFICTSDISDPYLDCLTFARPKGKYAEGEGLKVYRAKQDNYFIHRAAFTAQILFDYLSPDSQLVRYLRDDITRSPNIYPVTCMEFLKAYELVVVKINELFDTYNKTGVLSSRLAGHKVFLWNERMREDFKRGNYSTILCVKSIVKMGKSLGEIK